MAPSVEANSLSSITQLASNPPRYPRNPTESKRQSLVLYIARVPGSHDIILTPFKPGLKNVTAEDVASSLYFLHLQRPDDEALLATDGTLIEEEEEEDADDGARPKGPPIVTPRKPLPDSSSLLNDEQLEDLLPELPPRWSGPQSAGSNVFVDSPPALPPRQPTHQQPHLTDAKTSPERRPLGPRPQQSSEPRVPRKLLPGEENQALRPAIRTKVQEPHSIESSAPYQGQISPQLPSRPVVTDSARASLDNRSSGKAFTITVIRRDPTSSAQWNVGYISNYQAGEASSATPEVTPSSGSSLFIRLVTPGYNQFRNMLPSNPPPGNTLGTEEPKSSSSGPSYFARHVHMEGSQTSFWNRKINRGSVDFSGGLPTIRGRSGSGSAAAPGPFPGAQSSSPERPKPKCYVLASPWNGRCEFATGNGGRSLRCKHTLPNNTTAAAVISELRFNLPSAAIFNAPIHTPTDSHDGRTKRSKLQHIRNKLSSHVPPPSHQQQQQQQHDDLHPSKPSATSYPALYPSDVDADDDDDDDNVDSDDEHLDLSLGREAAGGGNRGKRAKLGKLIVHDEGLKMLDLIVAANMGIWWEIWDP
ncbi:MAG: hypothetical protein M1818_000625 [Claussenomyces sp. TS43310]|nr:MAG: hypothetical protein M1818_000625 [Claussenomyces sp. TS43310]